MDIKKGEIHFANSFLEENFDRIIDWVIGDIKKCARLKEDGSCEENGAFVGAFILWCCAIEYFGGLFTMKTSQSETKLRFQLFIERYMPQYDYSKIEDLRWSLSHYYSPHHYVLYQENNLVEGRKVHLTQIKGGIILHLGCAVKDLEEAVKTYYEDLKGDDNLKVKTWRFYKEHLPIMPLKINAQSFSQTYTSLPTAATTQIVSSAGTIEINGLQQGNS